MEYTPTTEEVRMYYAGTPQDFYRWLAERDRQKQEAERDRIIALLEAEMDNVSELPGALGETLSDHIFELIAHIKGENK